MNSHNRTIIGLRTQILENWRYMHPDHANVLIVTTYEEILEPHSHVYKAIIAQNRGHGKKIYLSAQSSWGIEAALYALLSSTNKLVKEVIENAPIEQLEVKSFDQNVIKTNDHGDKPDKEVKKPNHSPKDEELKKLAR